MIRHIPQSDRKSRTNKDGRAFTIVDRELIEGKRLPFEALGLLAYLLSKPEDWEVRVKQLIRLGRATKGGIQRAFKELEECGYARLLAFKDPQTGAFLGKRWEIYENPDDAVSGLSGNPTLRKPDGRETGFCNTEDSGSTEDGVLTEEGVGESSERVAGATSSEDFPDPSDPESSEEEGSTRSPSGSGAHSAAPESVREVLLHALTRERWEGRWTTSDVERFVDGIELPDGSYLPVGELLQRIEDQRTSEELQWAFSSIRYNNHEGWNLRGHWKTAFDGFRKSDAWQHRDEGPSRVAMDWIPEIVTSVPADFPEPF